MNSVVKQGLKAFEAAFKRYQEAMEMNTRFVPFEEKERELANYWQRRSTILFMLEQDNDAMAVANLKTFLDAMNIKADEMEKTKVRK